MHEEQDQELEKIASGEGENQKTDDSGEDQDAAPVDDSTVPPLQDEVVIEETVERTEVTPVEPTSTSDDDADRQAHDEQVSSASEAEVKSDADPPESNQTD